MIIVIDDKIGALSYVAYNLKECTSSTYHYSIEEALDGVFCYTYSASMVVEDLIGYLNHKGEIAYPPNLTFEELLTTYKLTYPEHFI